jgi:GNAT superfamily N-acetyltransferase
LVNIKPITAVNSGELHRIWESSIGSKWPISEGVLSSALGLGNETENQLRLGLWQKQTLCGAIITELTGPTSAALVLLVVDPVYQRQGFATRLLHETRKVLTSRGVNSISLGAGADKLLWHGVPTSLLGACLFFQKVGFVSDATSYDLIQNISSFEAPPDVFRCREIYSVSFEALCREDTMEMLAFEQRYFPDWLRYMERTIAQARHSHVLVAKLEDEIIGTVSLSIAPECPGGHWREFLGPKLGAFGILGVHPEHRQHGVGLALAAYATQTLRERGIQNCFLHWTWLRDWYGRLGFKVWEEYTMATLVVGHNN